ncbi:MAG: HD domain-containing protein [Oscillospiraceae bacterium]|nr:HD domain-containing protein [Oscillospiraceae bacterium]
MSTINPEIIEIIKKYNNGEYYNYIENTILPQYEKDKAHDVEHIYDVINRAFALNKNLELGLDFRVLSAAIFYHDIGRNINDETHEIISAEIFMSDETMKKFFTDGERNIIKEAIEDHRASLDGEPRNVYGKLVSSSDRNTNLELPLKRTYQYRCKKNPDSALEKKIRESFEHLNQKFGESGYAGTVYFDDGVYKKYLKEFRLLLDNYDLFRSEYLRVNQIDEIEVNGVKAKDYEKTLSHFADYEKERYTYTGSGLL